MNYSQTPEITPLGYQPEPGHAQQEFAQPDFGQAGFGQAQPSAPMQPSAPWPYGPPQGRPPAAASLPKRGTTAAVIAGVAFVAILGGGAYATFGGSQPQTTQVGLSSAEANPFSTPVGQDQPDITPAANGGGERSGDTEGLFAQNPDRPACDGQTLTKNLLADPAKSAAWASVLGIAPETIPGYVDGLTPVVLRANTAVTDHGFVDNDFTSYPAVLPAGTAVFINGFGEPTVRCFSGNPLTAGAASEDRSVTVVRPAPTVIQRNVFVDSHRGDKIIFVRDHDRDWDHRAHDDGDHGHGDHGGKGDGGDHGDHGGKSDGGDHGDQGGKGDGGKGDGGKGGNGTTGDAGTAGGAGTTGDARTTGGAATNGGAN